MINPKLIARIISNTDVKTKLRLAKVIPKLGKVDELTRCMLCPNMCLHVCPVFDAERRLTVSPAVKSRLAYFLREFPDRYEFFDSVFHCLPCNACREECPMDVSVNENLRKIRALLPGSKTESVKKIIEERVNRVREVKKSKEITHNGGRILYFPGCSAVESGIYDVTLKVLKKLDFSFEVSKEVCCGMPFLEIGDVERYNREIERLKREAKKYDGVISNCPSCVSVMRGEGIKASHITIALLPLLKDVKIKDGRKATYHDPCVLARELDVIEEGREILKKLGFEIVEAENNGRNTYCCGYGGIYKYFNPEGAEKIAEKRYRQLSVADLIVTSCPTCKMALSRNGEMRDVKDITELIAEKIHD